MGDWHTAQAHELAYHTQQVSQHWPSVAQRRAEDARLRRWYAGLLDLGPHIQTSVTDYGCGPESLLLEGWGKGLRVAVDPLTFTDADEAAYRERTIQRAVSPAETYQGPMTDEGWMYNCLQHVQDWREALKVALRHTGLTFRLFEWVDEPTSAVHLHTLKTEQLRVVLGTAGFRETWRVDGKAERVGKWTQAFYAGVWER